MEKEYIEKIVLREIRGKIIEPRLNIKDIDFHLVFVQVNILNFDRDFVHFKQTYQWLEREHTGAAGV